jgi:hypothetical protein
LPNWTSNSEPMSKLDSRCVWSTVGSRLSSPGINGADTSRHVALPTRPCVSICVPSEGGLSH